MQWKKNQTLHKLTNNRHRNCYMITRTENSRHIPPFSSKTNQTHHDNQQTKHTAQKITTQHERVKKDNKKN